MGRQLWRGRTRSEPARRSGGRCFRFLTLRTVFQTPGMDNSESLESVDVESLSGQLAVGFDVNELSLLSELSPPESASVVTGSPVRLSRVSTFIMGAKNDRYSFGYIVSSIGSHWGVVVGEDEEAFLYHLVFENRQDLVSDANPDSITGKVRAVTFDATLWKPAMTKGASMYNVGKTHYSAYELVRIGRTFPVDTTNQRPKNDQGVWRLSPRVLELSNLCQMFSSSHLSRAYCVI